MTGHAPQKEIHPIILTLNRVGERLDKALADALPDISRAQFQRLIREGHITVDGQAAKSSQRLSGKEQIIVKLPEVAESDLLAEKIDLDVRYEDDDILLVNKPAGMVVHPAAGHESGTLVNAILGYCPDLAGVGGEKRPGIVHRLDKDTSGLILVAKSDLGLRYLQKQFKARQIKKVYQTLVEGHFEQREVLIDAPIGRDPRNRQRMAVIPPGSSANARSARTVAKLLALYDGYSLLECRPLTGRTHQIRVHLAFAGHPIVGDAFYGRRKQRLELNRHFLHASGLTFRRPSDEAILTFECELPTELQTVLESLALESNT